MMNGRSNCQRRHKKKSFINRRYRIEKNQTSMESCKIGRRRGKESVFKRKRRREDGETVFKSLRKKKKKQKRREDRETVFQPSWRHIGNDVLEEIMVRLPVRSLIRFQILSKHWKHTINSRSFKERHLLRQKTQKLLSLSKRGSILKTYGFDWSSPTSCLIEEQVYHIEPQSLNRMSLSKSCDGLFCIFDKENITTPIIVTNPATRRSQVLPLSRLQRQCLEKSKKLRPRSLPFPGFGKDNVTGTKKLVWLHNNKRSNTNCTLSCEVFDFEVKEWRCVMDDTPFGLYAFGETVVAEGCVYWLSEKATILAYNLHTETFRVITDDVVSHASCSEAIYIRSVDDRLWLTNMGGSNVVQHFWRVKDPLESVWKSDKMFSVASTLCSLWFPDDVNFWPFIIVVATSKDDKQVLITMSCSSSKLVHMLPHPTSPVFRNVSSGTSDAVFTPYFQSLDFPF